MKETMIYNAPTLSCCGMPRAECTCPGEERVGDGVGEGRSFFPPEDDAEGPLLAPALYPELAVANEEDEDEPLSPEPRPVFAPGGDRGVVNAGRIRVPVGRSKRVTERERKTLDRERARREAAKQAKPIRNEEEDPDLLIPPTMTF